MIREIIDPGVKSSITEKILRDLPTWFGIEDSLMGYVSSVRNEMFYAAYQNNKPVGFISIKKHNMYTAEVSVMGIMKNYHKQGIGRKLMSVVQRRLKQDNFMYLSVKTLDESRESKSYEKTRHFYYAVGFRPVEVFKTLWDEANPCLLMIKTLGEGE